MNKTIQVRRPYSTHERKNGESIQNSTIFCNMEEQLASKEHIYSSIQSKYKQSKNKLASTLNNFHSSAGASITVTPRYLVSEQQTIRRQGQSQNSQRETPRLDESRLETSQGRNIGGIFVSAPLTSQLKKRTHKYSINNENQRFKSAQVSPPPSQNSSYFENQKYQKERRRYSTVRNTFYVSDLKKRNANQSIDYEIQQQNFIEEEDSNTKNALSQSSVKFIDQSQTKSQAQSQVKFYPQSYSRSQAASPNIRRSEEPNYSRLLNRSSIKKSENSIMEKSISSNMTNSRYTKQFSTLKKKHDILQRTLTAAEWRTKSISEQFKIIQDQGSLTKNIDQHYIKLDLKDEKLHKIFRKISNGPEQLQINNVRTNRSNIRNYLLKRYHESLVEKLITFLEIPPKVDFLGYVKFIEIFLNLTPKQKVVLCFMLLDENEDGYICNTDMFTFLRKNQNKLTEIDIKHISRFAQTDLNSLGSCANEENDIERVLIKKSGLTLTELKLFKKKGIECLIPTQVKKDTLYHASFQIIEHSNKYRQTLRQLEETKRNQLMDLRKNKKRTCKYQKDMFFCLNFDQFEIHLSRLPHILYIYFDILAYISLIQFQYVDYLNYDRIYYSQFQNYKNEQDEFKSEYSRLLKQYEDKVKFELSQQPQNKSPQILIERSNIPEKAFLNRSLTHRTTPVHSQDKPLNFNFKQG